MTSFDDLFQRCTGTAPYEFQRAFATAARWPDLVEAPTGSGKTATALLGWLWRRRFGSDAQRAEAGRRLVYCLPMRTLVEQTEAAARRWRAALGLRESELGIHVLMGGAVDDEWYEHPDRDAILIGTQDQLLSRALMRGYSMTPFRWAVDFALLHSDCTWIMDEVQLMGVGASTAAQLQAFRERHQVCGSAKTVWMTATLSEERLRTVDVRRELARMPFVAKEAPLQRRLRAVKTLKKAKHASGKDLAPLAKEIASEHEAGTLTVVIVNRVARAQQLRQLVAKELRGEPTALIHSRFRPADRRRVQEAALGGAFRGVLVATQAIEAGVDISAKTMFTELAPWSSLVQRFGRLNRAGEHKEARAFWIDLNTADKDLPLPYEAAVLELARAKLEQLEDVSPAALAKIAREREAPELPVLRHKDLLELFDTEPDLGGRQLDVSRFVRATDDRDVQVAWRELGDEGPAPDAPDLHRDELCTVPIHELERLSKGHDVWHFDSRRSRWAKPERLVPGMALLVDLSVGGYDAELGFTGAKDDVPAPVAVASPMATEGDSEDPLSYFAADYISLELHSQDVAEEMAALLEKCGALLPASTDRQELIDAARWHDAGKAHPAFQAMLLGGMAADDARRSQGPWAKSDGSSRTRNERRHFRHELASALTWLAEGRSDLGAYVIAAHHGKVRMSLRARPGEEPPPGPPRRFAHGIHEGDELPTTPLGGGIMVPAQALSLECMELGGEGTWTDRMQGLLEELGPFRLAYLEMLVRVADWRASARRARKLHQRSAKGSAP